MANNTFDILQTSKALSFKINKVPGMLRTCCHITPNQIIKKFMDCNIINIGFIEGTKSKKYTIKMKCYQIELDKLELGEFKCSITIAHSKPISYIGLVSYFQYIHLLC